jgi:hypothetical protein
VSLDASQSIIMLELPPLAVHGIKFETVTGVCVVLETGLI